MKPEQAKRLEVFLKKAESTNARIAYDTEKYRKGDGHLTVTDKNGKAIAGAKVLLSQKKHEFSFGCNCFMLDSMETPEKNAAYKEYVKKAFNTVTVPFYWNTLEPEQGKTRYTVDSPYIYRRPTPDACLAFCEENGIEPKLHCLNYDTFSPDWYKAKPIPEQKRLLEKRMREISERYADKIPGIEVTNELWWHESRVSAFYEAEDFVDWSYKTADKYFPNNFLIMNEGQDDNWILADIGAPTRQRYYLLIKEALANGCRIDRIGMQFHLWKRLAENPNFYDPDKLYRTMDTYGRFGKELQVTEVTIPPMAGGEDAEEYQAALLERYYRIWFSHKDMQAVIYWNLWDGYAYGAEIGDMTQGENIYYGGLINFDGTPKKAYNTLLSLLKEWHTETEAVTDEGGKATFRGYFGDYGATVVLPDGKTVKTALSISKYSKNNLAVTLPV